MISFALEDFSQCKQGDVLRCEATIHDIVNNEPWEREFYIIYHKLGPTFSYGYRVTDDGKRGWVVSLRANKNNHRYFLTTPDEWPDEIAAVRMKLILEGRLKI